MRKPDFARTGFDPLQDTDLRFLVEQFPAHGQSYEEIARLLEDLPNTLESSLNSERLFRRIFDRRRLILEISPFLLFNVLLRRGWEGPMSAPDRKVVNYIANLMSLFVQGDRMHRVEPHDAQPHAYITGLIEESLQADSRRQFLIHSHIGNYSLFLTGVFPQWLEYRHRYRRRPVDIQTYVDFGSGYFQQAATHRLAREFALDGVFMRLAMMFDSYRALMNRVSHEFLNPGFA